MTVPNDPLDGQEKIYDHRAEIINRIKPLVMEIERICEELEIPFIFAVQTALYDGGATYAAPFLSSINMPPGEAWMVEPRIWIAAAILKLGIISNAEIAEIVNIIYPRIVQYKEKENKDGQE